MERVDAGALRKWGMAASFAALAVAALIAVFARAPRPSIDVAAPTPATPILHRSRLWFTIQFAPDHPLARAQALAANGRHGEAWNAVEAGLLSRPELNGLCLAGFDANADIVLEPCAPLPPARLERMRRIWSARLEGMSGISYAQSTLILHDER
ncbi:MAG TPA: hypothetical protein VG841_11855 [Caulobacterales bacterium]|nr:hypothetical protein [Caulobacterales bacterium]